jgi:hypothetical protein
MLSCGLSQGTINPDRASGSLQKIAPDAKQSGGKAISLLKSALVLTQWLAFGLGVLVFSACAQTPQSASHPPAPPLAAPKTMEVISDPTSARIAVNQEYLGEVIRFPAEAENGKYAFERTILGAGAAIARAITGQSSENPHQLTEQNAANPHMRQNR